MKNGDKGINRIGDRISFFLGKMITLTFFYYARINTKFITRVLQINISLFKHKTKSN